MIGPTVEGPTATVRRVLNATPEEIFDAWTDPEQARHWMCPPGSTVPELILEAEVGGRLRLVMRVNERDFVHLGEFLEVERPRRLVFTWITMYTHYRKSVVTVQLQPAAERTELTITHVLLPNEELAEAHRRGWEGLLDQVGVAGEVRQSALDQEPLPSVYFGTLLPGAFSYTDTRSMTYALRVAGRPAEITAEVREVVWSIDPNLPVDNVRTMRQALARSMARTSFTMVLISIAAGIALLLGSVGIYGVMAYVVSLRTSEIGVRMALGAETGTIVRMVLGQAGLLIGLGIVLGLVGAFGLTRLLGSLLFGVAPADVATYLGVSLLLGLVAVLASYVPAYRASRVDPVEALQRR